MYFGDICEYFYSSNIFEYLQMFDDLGHNIGFEEMLFDVTRSSPQVNFCSLLCKLKI